MVRVNHLAITLFTAHLELGMVLLYHLNPLKYPLLFIYFIYNIYTGQTFQRKGVPCILHTQQLPFCPYHCAFLFLIIMA